MYSYEELETNEVIRLCRERDEEAFAELVRRYTPLMHGRASEFSSGGIGYEELFAEACVGLHSAAMRFDLGQVAVTFGLFARVCIDNRIVDLIRKSKGGAQLTVELDEKSGEDERPDLEEELVRREMLSEVFCAARELLSEYEYQVLMLHIQGYKTAAIAKALSRSAKSVDNAKSRIFRRLRGALGNSSDIN